MRRRAKGCTSRAWLRYPFSILTLWFWLWLFHIFLSFSSAFQVYVSSPEETLMVMKEGTSNRAIAATSEWHWSFEQFVRNGEWTFPLLCRHERREFQKSFSHGLGDQSEEFEGWIKQVRKAVPGRFGRLRNGSFPPFATHSSFVHDLTFSCVLSFRSAKQEQQGRPWRKPRRLTSH